MIFYTKLNEEVRNFIKRANGSHFERNKIGGLYVEYYEERLYWIYDYKLDFVSMLYASSPIKAVEQYKTVYYNNRTVNLKGNSQYIENVNTINFGEDE